MERFCSTGQSPQRAVAPTDEEEHVSSSHVPIIRRINCMNTTSGICHSVQISVSQPPRRGPVPGPGINYTGPQEVLLEVVILVF